MEHFESDDLNKDIATVDKGIATKLRDLRIGAGVGCAEFAEALSIEVSDLNSYEDGTEAVPASVIALVCALSGTPYEHFFGEDSDSEAAANVAKSKKEEHAEVVS